VGVLGVLFGASILVAAPPAKPITLSPDGAPFPTEITPQFFTWDGDSGTWSQIWIRRNGQDYHTAWVQSHFWHCDHDLPAGQYAWWVRTWNVDGLSLWSAEATFTKTKAAVMGDAPNNVGVYGRAGNYGFFGVYGQAGNQYGVYGTAHGDYGVYGRTDDDYGVAGFASDDYGVYGQAGDDYGVRGSAGGDWGGYFTSGSGKTLYCNGDMYITGSVRDQYGGYKAFTIDHPVEPKTKVLRHFCAEGPEALVVYRGKVVIGKNGRAVVELPDYFDALTREAHIQLTPVGNHTVYIADEVSGNTFAVGGPASTKVHWVVTAERDDPKARQERKQRPVEQKKGAPGLPAKGKYISPECYGQR